MAIYSLDIGNSNNRQTPLSIGVTAAHQDSCHMHVGVSQCRLKTCLGETKPRVVGRICKQLFGFMNFQDSWLKADPGFEEEVV